MAKLLFQGNGSFRIITDSGIFKFLESNAY